MYLHRKRLLAAALSVALFATTNAALAATKLENNYSHHYHYVKNHTKYDPGPNLRQIAQLSGHRASEITLKQAIKKLKKQERKALAVVPATALARCIIDSESHGNPQAHNSSGHNGIAQWSDEAWARHGGHKFAKSPLGASYGEQVQVLNHALAKFGCSDWCPFDPC